MKNDDQQRITNGIVHAGFRGFRRFVARKKSRCKLIGNRFVIPHDTIPSNVCVLNRTIRTSSLGAVQKMEDFYEPM